MGELSTSARCTPLEVPAPYAAGATYLDYWLEREALERDIKRKEAEYLAELTFKGTEFIWNPDGRDPYKVVHRLDGAFGSFNPMRQGSDVMALGAGLLMQANQMGTWCIYPVVQAQPDSTVEAFMETVDRRGIIESQQPTRALQLAGELVQKTGLIEQDPARQQALMGLAKTIYGRIYHDNDLPWTEGRLHAGRLLASVERWDLGRRIRAARRAHQDVKSFRREGIALLKGQAQDLLRYADFSDDNPGVRRAIAGEAGERIVELAVGDLTYLHSGLKGSFIEIRTALGSEEDPQHPRGSKKRSFDIACIRTDANDNVVAGRMWQIKSGHTVKDHIEPYHPDIDPIVIGNLTLDIALDAAGKLHQTYASGGAQAGPTNLHVVTHVIEPFMELPREAA